MKNVLDLSAGFARKARTDPIAMKACQRAGAPEAACFHAQQAAEMAMKAVILSRDFDFPHTHDILTLVELVVPIDNRFKRFLKAGETLTPYAVKVRYDMRLSPTKGDAQKAARLGKRSVGWR
jgi:HEPN domain-containing protein